MDHVILESNGPDARDTTEARPPCPGHRDAFEHWRKEKMAEIEAALDSWVSPQAPAGLGQAMRYGVLGGGKRLRALLALAAGEATGAPHAASMRAACAVELIHAYSLVHDDLPCMDDDVLRRGKPTVHVQFGEAQAMLAGDALQALAFEVLASGDGIVPALQGRVCHMLACASGCMGMAGGQAIDLASTGQSLDEPALCDMHRRKTGALLRASVLMGAACGSVGPRQLQALGDYADAIGLAFQVVDDILDVTQTAQVLGKTAGKDSACGKPTYVSVLGLAAARSKASELGDAGRRALARSGLADTQWLERLAFDVVDRNR